MHAFITPDGTSDTDDDILLRKVSGQALAMLAMDGSGNNCVAMLRETGYALVQELACMIHDDWYRCIAASLLRSLCLHARHELKATDLNFFRKENLFRLYITEVLERILLAESAELEILIGLSSQVSKTFPEELARELEHREIMEAFTKRLADVLDANMEPRGDCPGIRRMVLEQVINLMEHNSRYVNCFNNHAWSETIFSSLRGQEAAWCPSLRHLQHLVALVQFIALWLVAKQLQQLTVDGGRDYIRG
ncbi:hypothetical protein U9M48_016034 [Paspalum notatum var. saurae]|uniref:Uncharacterized protein n=1 Tax=Paspalum notatum var. saurae TaxID=547442 RepID=A0AAQ3T5D7_PASNO